MPYKDERREDRCLHMKTTSEHDIPKVAEEKTRIVSGERRLLSIVIPTYNGEETLNRTLESIVSQVEGLGESRADIEIVLGDDCSEDRTYGIIETYATRYGYIRGFRNVQTLGMDRNFKRVALEAKGKFLWFSGQDDLFGEGAVKKVLAVLNNQANLGIVYLNYSQYNHDMTETICQSMLHKEAFLPDKLEESEDLIFQSSDEYFSFFESLPSFLPATIMRRDYWLTRNLEQYIGTHYIQAAVLYLNANRHNIYVVTKPYIKGRIPDNGWQANGQTLFSTMTGSLKMKVMVYREKNNAIPSTIYARARKRYLLNFFFLVHHSKQLGMQPTKDLLEDLQLIFGKGFIYYAYIHPILLSPSRLLAILCIPLKLCKKTILSIGRIFGWKP